MIWYRLNINYLSREYDNKAMEISEPLGNNEEIATQKYFEKLAENEKCLDNDLMPARIDLTKYVYDNDTTTSIILYKNY